MLEIFSNVFFCSLECPAVETKYFFLISILAFKTAPVLRFQHFGLPQSRPVLRFLAFRKKIRQIPSPSCMNTPTRNKGGGGGVIRELLLVLCVWGKDAVGTRGETGRLFFF